jgi:hypothetical protein
MKCIECKNCDLQLYPKMSKLGFGFCTLKVATYYSLYKNIECDKFIEADTQIIDARKEWFSKHFKD